MNVSIINEDFLLNMHDSNTNHFHCDFRIDNVSFVILELDSIILRLNIVVFQANLFKPKQSILQHLLHFDHLTLSGMTLNVNWVTKFIMVRLQKNNHLQCLFLFFYFYITDVPRPFSYDQERTWNI